MYTVDTTNGTGKLTYMDKAKDTLNSNEKGTKKKEWLMLHCKGLQ